MPQESAGGDSMYSSNMIYDAAQGDECCCISNFNINILRDPVIANINTDLCQIKPLFTNLICRTAKYLGEPNMIGLIKSASDCMMNLYWEYFISFDFELEKHKKILS